QSERPLCALVVFPEEIAGDAVRFFITHVPNKAIHASFRLDLLLGLLVIGIPWLIERFIFLARILADHSTGGVEDLDLDLVLRSLLEVVVDDGAAGRVLAGEQCATWRFSGMPTIRCRRLIDVDIFVGHGIRKLAER